MLQILHFHFEFEGGVKAIYYEALYIVISIYRRKYLSSQIPKVSKKFHQGELAVAIRP
jgi:hypothetical protein